MRVETIREVTIQLNGNGRKLMNVRLLCEQI